MGLIRHSCHLAAERRRRSGPSSQLCRSGRVAEAVREARARDTLISSARGNVVCSLGRWTRADAAIGMAVL